jgi:hypothetical protein
MSKACFALLMAVIPGAALADPPQDTMLALGQNHLSVNVSGGAANDDGTGVEGSTQLDLDLGDASAKVTGSFTADANDPAATAASQDSRFGLSSRVTGPAGIRFGFSASSDTEDQRQDGALSPPGVSGTNALTTTQSARASATANPFAGVSVTAGVSDSRAQSASESRPLVGTAQASAVASDDRQTFLKAGWSPFSFLTLNAQEKSVSIGASARAPDAITDQYRYEEPGVSASLGLWNGAQLKARVEDAVAPINLANLAMLSSAAGAGQTPQIAPDRDRRGELGFRQTFPGGATVSASASAARIESTTELTMTEAGDVAPVSVTGGMRRRADLALSLPLAGLGLSDTSIDSQATWNWSRIRDPMTGTPRAVSGQVPCTADLRLVHQNAVGDLKWGMTATLATDQEIYQPAEVSEIHSDSGLGAFVQYKPGKYALSLDVDGLVGGARSEADSYYLDDRADSGIDRIERTADSDPLVTFTLSRSF